jgi:hypothetical protein
LINQPTNQPTTPPHQPTNPIAQELADQQLKQMLLAYMVLIMKERPMLHQDLDDACEVSLVLH